MDTDPENGDAIEQEVSEKIEVHDGGFTTESEDFDEVDYCEQYLYR